jgi:NADPH2:quinone reductase
MTHAIRQYEFGPAENLLFEEVPAPVPGRGQVRVQVAAAGVHLVDTTIRSGAPGPFPLPRLPMTPGREVAGTVDVLGDGVDAGWLGKRVVVHLGMASGGYAELVVADAESLHVVPEGLPADQAVAMIGTGRTTFAVLEVAGVRADDVVLVSAAAGGMGSLLVQAAKNAGAFVIGLAGGAEKVRLVRGLGADVVVDYRGEGWAEQVRAVGRSLSLVLDGVGGVPGRQSLELLSPGGRIVLYGASAGEFTQVSTGDLFSLGVSAAVAIGPRLARRGLRVFETAALAAAGRGEVTPVTQAFPLAKAAEAHVALQSRGTVGKVVLVP